MWITSFRIALKALQRGKLRTGLAMLGMAIGVAAVIAMAAVGTGASDAIASQIQPAGAALINVRAGNYTRGDASSNGMGAAATLTANDAAEIGKLDGVKYDSANVLLRTWVNAGQHRFYAQVEGTDASFPEIHQWKFDQGRYFQPADVSSGARVAVLGPIARDRLFGADANPAGKSIVLRGQEFRVISVTGSADEQQIETVFVPFTALQKILGIGHVHSITVFAAQSAAAFDIAAKIRTLLRKRHRLDIESVMERVRNTGLPGNQMPGAGSGFGAPDDFTVTTQAAEALTKGLSTSVAAFVLANMPKVDRVNVAEMAGTLHRAGTTMTALLAAIAAISLIVGGVGIMNIMLISVTERTGEIGIRRTVGARQRDVLAQFLMEALTLGMCGGAAGIALGLGGALAIAHWLDWPAPVRLVSVALAFGISAAVGVCAGVYPALRASRHDPILALRHE
jgi:putative ABC transport system permease protein